MHICPSVSLNLFVGQKLYSENLERWGIQKNKYSTESLQHELWNFEALYFALLYQYLLVTKYFPTVGTDSKFLDSSRNIVSCLCRSRTNSDDQVLICSLFSRHHLGSKKKSGNCKQKRKFLLLSAFNPLGGIHKFHCIWETFCRELFSKSSYNP